jgi:hypothetical protein
MNNIISIIICIVSLAFIGLCVYGGFLLKRNINYKLSYESMVQQEIIKMVKPESLKPEYQK